MYSVSNDYHAKVIDGKTPQAFVLRFLKDPAMVLSSLDGDFTTAPVTITDIAFVNESIELGDCASKTLSFTLQNTGLRFSGYGFGEAQAYIGVQTSKTAVSGAEKSVTYNTHTITYDGVNVVDIDGTPHIADDLVYMVIVNDTLYCISSLVGSGWYYDFNTATTTAWDAAAATIAKTSEMQIVIIDESAMTYEVRRAGYVYDYELCPMGVFNIERPAQTKRQTIEITDAYDRMRQLDEDASSWLSQLTFPTTIGGILTSLLNAVNSSYTYVTPLFYGWLSDPVAANNFPSATYTYRDILFYIAEAGGAIAYFNRVGVLEFGKIEHYGDPDVVTIQPTQIVAGSEEIYDYQTNGVSDVLVKTVSGQTIQVTVNPYLTPPSYYSILGNPFINGTPNIYVQDVCGFFPTFYPMSFELTELDPSVYSGDPVSVISDGVTYLAQILTEQKIVWCGKTYGEYVCKGEERRHADKLEDISAYNGYTANQAAEADNSGSVNWTWQRFSNGLCILMGKRTVSGLTFGAWGSCYTSGTGSISSVSYPFTFDSAPYIVTQMENAGGDVDGWLSASGTAGTASVTPAYEVVRPSSVVGTHSVNVYYLVVGFYTT